MLKSWSWYTNTTVFTGDLYLMRQQQPLRVVVECPEDEDQQRSFDTRPSNAFFLTESALNSRTNIF